MRWLFLHSILFLFPLLGISEATAFLDMAEQNADIPSIKCEKVSGNVQWQKSSGESAKLKSGDVIAPGDSILTNDSAQADFALADGSVFRVGKSSNILLQSISFDKHVPQLSIYMSRGQLYSNAKNYEKSNQPVIRIFTPVVQANSNNGSFLVTHLIENDKSVSQIYTFSGKTAVLALQKISNKNKNFTVFPSNLISISSERNSAVIEEKKFEQIDNSLQKLSLLEEKLLFAENKFKKEQVAELQKENRLLLEELRDSLRRVRAKLKAQRTATEHKNATAN